MEQEHRFEHGQRGYVVIERLADIKARNAAVRNLTAQGYDVTPGGYKGYYRVKGWKGERPYMVVEKYDLRNGDETITPVYKRADGTRELIDGSPFRL